MPYFICDGVAKWFLVIITPSYRIAPLDPWMTDDVADSPNTAPSMVSAVVAARNDDVVVTFRCLTYCFLSDLHDIQVSNHFYIRESGGPGIVDSMEKVPGAQRFPPGVTCHTTRYITVPLNIERPPNNQGVRSYMDDGIGDSFVIPQNQATSPFNMIMAILYIARLQR